MKKVGNILQVKNLRKKVKSPFITRKYISIIYLTHNEISIYSDQFCWHITYQDSGHLTNYQTVVDTFTKSIMMHWLTKTFVISDIDLPQSNLRLRMKLQLNRIEDTFMCQNKLEIWHKCLFGLHILYSIYEPDEVSTYFTKWRGYRPMYSTLLPF